MDSYFEQGVKLVGTLWVKGHVHFEGELEGEVFSSDHFLVGKGGMIFGDVKTFDVTNLGKVRGNIYAKNKVSLADQSSLIGDISTYHLVIDEGSNFEGSCKMIDGPPNRKKEPEQSVKKSAPPSKSVEKKASKPSSKPVTRFSGKLSISAAIIILLAVGWFYPKISASRLGRLLEQGFIRLEDKRYADAEKLFKKAAAISQTEPKVYVGLGQVYLEKNQIDKAIKHLKKSIELNPLEKSYKLQLAKALTANQQFKEANKTYQEILLNDSKNFEAFRGLGIIQSQQGQLGQAIKNLKLAVKIKPDDFLSHKTLSDLYVQKGEMRQALHETQEALRLKEDDPLLFISLGELFLKSNRENDASKAFKKGAQLFPENFQAQIRLADWYFQKGALDDSFRYYNVATKLQPKNEKVLSKLGKFFLDRNQIQDAKSTFQKALKIKPNDLTNLMYLGKVYMVENNWKEARSILESAKVLDGKNHKVLFDLSKVYIESGKILKGIQELQSAIRINNRSIPYHLALSDAFITQNKLDKSLEVLNKAWGIDKDNGEISYHLCNVYSKKGYYTVGIRHCGRAVKLVPDYYDAMNRLAWLFAKKKMNLESALAMSSKTVDAKPKEPGYIDTLSEIHYVQGNIEAAIENIQKAIKLDPEESYYKKQLWKFKNVKPKPVS